MATSNLAVLQPARLMGMPVSRRYLVPADLTVGQFVYVIRKRIKVSPEKAIFMFVKNVLPPTGTMHSPFAILTALVPSMDLSACVELREHWQRPLTCALLCAAALMSDVYEDHKDEDGFLYITYSGENTFGC